MDHTSPTGTHRVTCGNSTSCHRFSEPEEKFTNDNGLLIKNKKALYTTCVYGYINTINIKR